MGPGPGCVKVCRDINVRVAVRSLQSDKGEVCVHVRSEGAHIKCPQGDHGEGFVRIQEDSLGGYSGSPVQVHAPSGQPSGSCSVIYDIGGAVNPPTRR